MSQINNSRSLYISAFATGDGMSSARYAQIILTKSFIETLLRLQKICIDNNFPK
jgi:hypothetical protein